MEQRMEELPHKEGDVSLGGIIVGDAELLCSNILEAKKDIQLSLEASNGLYSTFINGTSLSNYNI